MLTYSQEDRGYKLGRIDDIPIESKPKRPNGKYKFSKRVNRLQWADQIKPLFDVISKDYRSKGGQHYGKINIKKIKENGETKEIEKQVNIKIDFSVGRPCFLSVEKEEDLEAAYRKVLDALSGR